MSLVVKMIFQWFWVRLDKNSLKGSVFFKSNNFSAESIAMILPVSSLWAFVKSWKLKFVSKYGALRLEDTDGWINPHSDVKDKVLEKLDSIKAMVGKPVILLNFVLVR